MNKQIGIAATCMTMTLSLACAVAAAQDLGKLGGMIPGASGLSSGSMSNVAGLLQYCVKNNYLGGSSGAAGIQDQLMGKLGGSSGSSGSSTSDMLGKVGGSSDTSSSSSDMLGQLTGSKKSDTAATTGSADPTSDPGYLAGAQGMLQSGSGKSTDLTSLGGGSSDLQAKLTKQVCDTVLKQGKSFVGM